MNPKQNNYAFIDSQNVNLAIRTQGWSLDFKKFREYLRDKYDVQKAYLFIGYLAKNEGLYRPLRSDGFILVTKPTLPLPDGRVKGNCDAELVLHTMIEYPNYDQAVIISNDGDFYCLVEYLESKGKLSCLLIPNRWAFSSLLRKFMARIHFMNDLKKKLIKNNTRM